MLGYAQQLFLENYSKNPWSSRGQKAFHWPLLEKMLQAECLGYIDIALAQRILQNIPDADESWAAFICHISFAARQGHLCVHISQEQIHPSPEEVWLQTENSKEHTSDLISLFSRLNTLILRGAETLDSRLMIDQPREPSRSSKEKFQLETSITPIHKNNSCYYLQRFWQMESFFIEHLATLLAQKTPQIALDLQQANAIVNSLQSEQKLLPEQTSAILHGCAHPFTIITGGPGTGKTYTAGVLLRTFWESMSLEQRASCRFAIAAPTGKAAAQLEASIRKAMHDVPDFPLITAQTLHSLLGMGRYGKRKSTSLGAADILLVDECSMIDARMMGHLMAELKPGSRLIMLGDRHQLPPVETGSLFADLVIHLQKNVETAEYVSELKTCLRAELKSIIEIADHIKIGNKLALQTLFREQREGIKHVAFNEDDPPKNRQRQLLAHILPFFAEMDKPGSHFSRFRLITPLRKGPFGVETLNTLCYQALLARHQNSDFFASPIMITANHPRLQLFNGEMGILFKSTQDSALDYAYFPSRKAGENVRKIDALLLPKYEYAYCVSIHKSQGSEFDHVVMILPEGSEYFGREALYTGITRAKKQLEIWGSEETINKMLAKEGLRHSGIGEKM